ncbi:hypothetical protein J2Z69_000306 [Paenibacillus shirakamiensis]|uniref:Cellobiose phosphorylase n=1 Tax=Paenibacillus shirakamiensis TaxID=1265935 RepID=A0ABS4JC32_9BACL|nr:hypothetical protein [Paenibacillus shirakamiensis]MBP1999287.1 hypothetical protein [Paenibacillus shirakamiensis]
MEAYYNCMRCMNKRVRIMTVDGNHYEGVITNVDRENVYLDTRGEGRTVQTSGFYPGYGYGYGYGAGAGILSLSLFSLLALALI